MYKCTFKFIDLESSFHSNVKVIADLLRELLVWKLLVQIYIQPLVLYASYYTCPLKCILDKGCSMTLSLIAKSKNLQYIGNAYSRWALHVILDYLVERLEFIWIEKSYNYFVWLSFYRKAQLAVYNLLRRIER